jgi:hypothetical protein
MDVLNVGDRVQNRRGWTGTVVKVDDSNAWLEFDNGEPSSPFPRDEITVDGGVLILLSRAAGR